MTQTRPGVWRLRVTTGYDRKTGNPRQASRTFRGTEQQARVALARFVTEADDGAASVSKAMTVAAYLDRWMEHVRAHRQPDTIRNYQLRCGRFKAELGAVRLDRLTALHLDEMYRRWSAEGLAPSTVRAYHGVMSSALGQAVKWGLLTRSVAPLATLPTVPRRRMSLPSVETVRLLVKESEADDPVLSAAIMLAALTGCRRGELLGFRWSDLDRDRMVLRVERSLKREAAGRGVMIGPTKTHQDRRIALDGVSVAVIQTHRRRAEEWARAAGVVLEDDGFMLTEDPSGRTPLAPDTLTHRFSRLAVRVGVGPLRFHDLRHSVATALLGAGYDLAVVAGRLGHRDPTITLRVYSHALEQRDRQAASTLGALLGPLGVSPS
jgi:integrase